MEDYPSIIYRNYLERFSSTKTKYSLIFAFDSIQNFFNYVLFTLANLILDIWLLRKLQITLNEKENRIKEDVKKLDKNFGNFLYLISLSLNFFFYNSFDKKFNKSFQKLCGYTSNEKFNSNTLSTVNK